MSRWHSYTWQERFNDRVNKTDSCWLWTGRKSAGGYGNMVIEGKRHYVHRLALKISGVAVPDDKCVCHHCDIKLCVNPKHLFIGTFADNNRDRKEKGRNRKTALTKKKITEIRKRGLAGPRGIQTELAKEFGLSKTHVHIIVRQKCTFSV